MSIREINEFFSRRSVLAALTILPALLLFFFVNLLPIMWAIYGSFFEIPIFSTEWTWIGLGNYSDLMQNELFYDSLWRSVLFAAGSTSFQLGIGVLLALVVSKPFRFNSIVRTIVILPYLVPTAVLGFISFWMANSTYGVINQIIYQLGIIDEFIPWFGDSSLAMISVVLTNSWKYTIFVTIMVLARLQAIPSSKYEAAKVLGATPYQRFRDITLPNLKGIIFIVLLLRGIWMFNKFDIVWILTRGGPGRSTETAPIHVYNLVFTEQQLGAGLAMSVILFLMLVIASLAYFYFLQPSQEVEAK